MTAVIESDYVITCLR